MKKIIKFLLVITIVLFVSNVNALVDESLHSERGHITCISFIDTENSPNNIESKACGQANGSKISKKLSVTKFSRDGVIYEFLGWYDEYGNKVDSYYNGDETRIKVSYTYSKDKCQDIKYYLKWKELKSPILNFVYTDNVSTGSGSWNNSNGTAESFTHTFKTPEEQSHYKFLYWTIDQDKYYENDKYTYDFSDKEYNTIEEVNAFAVWQSSVVLNLYDENKLLDTMESFESIELNYTPNKTGYEFIGWYDEYGNKVDNTIYYPYEESIYKVEPKVINLYAKWKKEQVEIHITKEWKDNNNIEGIRPNSIIVNLYGNDKLIKEITLSNGNWSYTDILDKYDELGNKIIYKIEEIKIDGYTSYINEFNITNIIEEKEDVIEEVEVTPIKEIEPVKEETKDIDELDNKEDVKVEKEDKEKQEIVKEEEIVLPPKTGCNIIMNDIILYVEDRKRF